MTPACGRDRTPADRALDYTCIRPAGHSGPCAMAYVHEGMPPGPVDRALFSSAGGLWLLVVLVVLAALLFFGVKAFAAALDAPDGYHLLPFAKVRTHRKACVVGIVTYVRHQVLDHDWHITLDDGHGHLLVVEIIPELPLPPAKKGQRVLACGISGFDEHHGWNEIHPLTRPFQVQP